MMPKYKLVTLDLGPCPCCGKETIYGVGRFDICSNCRWEDDGIQRDDPDYDGGANEMSLNEAKKAYKEGRKVT